MTPWNIIVFSKDKDKVQSKDFDRDAYYPRPEFGMSEATGKPTDCQASKDRFLDCLVKGHTISEAADSNSMVPSTQAFGPDGWTWVVYELNHHARIAVIFNEAKRTCGVVRAFISNHKRHQKLYEPDFTVISRMVELRTSSTPHRAPRGSVYRRGSRGPASFKHNLFTIRDTKKTH